MKSKAILSSVLLLFPILCVAKSTDYVITDYGAKADTSFLSTKAIQKAIDIAYNAGGGRVVVPAGNFKTGSIFIKDNVWLYLAPGATLYGSPYKKDYIEAHTEYVSLRTAVPTIQLIYGENIHDAGICGEGTIDGQGSHFRRRVMGNSDEGIERPHLIRFVTSRNITVKDVTLRNSGCWMQHYLACDNVRLTGLKIFNRSTHNNDAVDIDGCHDVVISDLICDSDDDGITLKSTSPRLTENVVITNCVISSHCNAIKLGTETTGGFRNIAISNCVIKPSDVPGVTFGRPNGLSGVSLEIVDGGILEGVTVSNILIRGTASPIFVRLGNRARPYCADAKPAGVGQLKDVIISDVTAYAAESVGCSITGIPGHNVENILLKDVTLVLPGNPGEYASEPAENETQYPECVMFGTLPASGFFVRHASGVKFDNVKVKTLAPDPRPEFKFVDCVN